LRIFLLKKRAIKKDIFLLVIIVIHVSFVCTIIAIRVVLQKKYNNIFILILLKEIARI